MFIKLADYIEQNQHKLQIRWNVQGKSGTAELDHCRRVVQYSQHKQVVVEKATPKAKTVKKVSNE